MKHLAMKQVPRYTSYPTAPHFGVMGAGEYSKWLQSIDKDIPVSLYVHIPFCEQLCWYCGCNTKITSKYAPIESYVDHVIKEIDSVVASLPAKMKVSHIAWGGGTPTKLTPPDFKRISDKIMSSFDVLTGAEIAVEIDPRTLTDDMVETLGACGVNRASFGVQDFDAGVQEAINRIQPYNMTKRVVESLRAVGVSSVNFDLIYGLPLQTEETIIDTVEKTKSLMPDRIALFGYAHVPWMKKHQLLLERHHLPTTEERLVLVERATRELVSAGYVQIGLDHFALPTDEMAIHWKEGTLNRNFQGYTVDRAQTLIAFGASAIGKLPNAYIQNHTSVKDYNDAVHKTGYATNKGVELNAADKLRADIIGSLMCTLSVNLKDVCNAHGVDIESLAFDSAKVEEYIPTGIVKMSGDCIEITKEGQPYVRLIASCYDSYLESGKAKHSAAV
tara:strand:- start:15432 stop:16766 length:1335 start_codon:yes stop_codon:yes gene_type:complete